MNKGRFKLTEQDFIKQNYNRLTYQEIAAQLNRDVNSVREFIEKKLGKNVITAEDFEDKAEFDIKRRPFWKQLSMEFDESELELFVYQWKRIISQFKDDVFPTEEMQVIHAIKLEIMMNRKIRQGNEVEDSIANLHTILDLEKKADEEHRNAAFIAELERQISVLRMAQDTYGKEYREMLTKQQSILGSLKGTRDQRIKVMEDSRQSFMSWMKNVLENVQLRKELGMNMEKNRLAMENERRRLSEYHKYVDGAVDRPILNFESITEEDTKEN